MSTITVNGMHCQNCSNSVKEAMAKAGANNIVVDLEKKMRILGRLSYQGAGKGNYRQSRL